MGTNLAAALTTWGKPSSECVPDDAGRRDCRGEQYHADSVRDAGASKDGWTACERTTGISGSGLQDFTLARVPLAA